MGEEKPSKRKGGRKPKGPQPRTVRQQTMLMADTDAAMKKRAKAADETASTWIEGAVIQRLEGTE